MKGLTHEQTAELKRRIVEYRKQGHYASECAKYFGVSVHYVHLACKGIDYPWKYDTETMSKAAKEQNGHREKYDEAAAVELIRNKAQWCEYVGGFTSYEGRVDVKCRTCGEHINVSVTTLRGDKYGNECPECRRRQQEADKAAREKARAEAKAEEEETKRLERLRRTRFKQISFRTCPTCGSLFYSSHKYCSAECMKRSLNAIGKDKRVQKIKATERDAGITLEKLYNQSGGVCAICGQLCDWNDYYISDGGYFIAGNVYPSIDHIMPLSKGGKHKWNNIQLAHRICNTLKSDDFIPSSEKSG